MTSLPDAPRFQPYLIVADAARAIEVYGRVFGMTERYRLPMGGRIGHAELEMPGFRLLLASEFPESGLRGPQGISPVGLLLYVEDVDAVVERALAAGFTQEGETKDEFHGDRGAKLTDPFGHRWFLNQQLEDLAPEEIVVRFEAMMASG